MKKIILSLTVLCVLILTANPVFSTSRKNQSYCSKKDKSIKKKEISIGSNRASGDLQLRFLAAVAGKVSITILNETGEIVLQQTNEVSKSINHIPVKKVLELTEGPYTVHLISNNETFTTRFLIWK
jgi:uncharacterized membrane protein